MKTIDIKSVFLGIIITTGIIVLISGKSQVVEDEFQIVPTSLGFNVYNKKTKLLYQYIHAGTKLRSKPENIYKIAPDGSEIILQDK
jgi:hypothetical protein